MGRRSLTVMLGACCAIAIALTCWIAFPTKSSLALPAPLEAWSGENPAAEYARDFTPLATAFKPQMYRSFCGPASIETVLRAYGQADVGQTDVFPSLVFKLDTFYSGVSLAQLDDLARSTGLRTELAYADSLTVDQFRDRIRTNLTQAGDFVLVNYDRRVLKQEGAGHISAVGAYDQSRDAFLILDEAAYKYPFTWVPAPLLYDAVHTRTKDRFRGVLFIRGYDSSSALSERASRKPMND